MDTIHCILWVYMWYNLFFPINVDFTPKNVKFHPRGTGFFPGNIKICLRYILRMPKLLLEKMCSCSSWEPLLPTKLTTLCVCVCLCVPYLLLDRWTDFLHIWGNVTNNIGEWHDICCMTLCERSRSPEVIAIFYLFVSM